MHFSERLKQEKIFVITSVFKLFWDKCYKIFTDVNHEFS